MSKNERLHDKGTFDVAIKDVERYIQSFAPRKLSDKVGTQAGTFVMTSDWTDFKRRLSEDELQKIEDTEDYFWDRRFELAREYYTINNINKYMRHWTTKPSTLRFLGPKERRIKK
jgi:alkyl sulfatase BDS1-like metallo-beta-lactamase superfamily hydrolase